MARELINLEDEEKLGPAMRELNAKQRAFVVGLVVHGLTQVKAYEAAGYEPRCSGANASRLVRLPSVQAALLEVGQQMLRVSGADAIRILGQLMLDTSVDPKERIACAKIILDRSGFVQVTKHQVEVEHHLSEAEVDRKLNQLAQELGLAKRAEAITVEATPVPEPAPEPEPEPEPVADSGEATPVPTPADDIDDLLIGVAPND